MKRYIAMFMALAMMITGIPLKSFADEGLVLSVSNSSPYVNETVRFTVPSSVGEATLYQKSLATGSVGPIGALRFQEPYLMKDIRVPSPATYEYWVVSSGGIESNHITLSYTALGQLDVIQLHPYEQRTVVGEPIYYSWDPVPNATYYVFDNGGIHPQPYVDGVTFSQAGKHTLLIEAVAPGYISSYATVTFYVGEQTKPAYPTINGFSVTQNAAIGDPIVLSGVVNGNGANLKSVSVTLQSQDYSGWHTSWGYIEGINAETFDLSSFGTKRAGFDINENEICEGNWVLEVHVETEIGLEFETKQQKTITVTETTAAAPTLDSFSVNPSTVTEGNTLSISGTVYGNGSKLAAVAVGVRKASDESLGGYWGHSGEISADTFDLSSFGTLKAGETIGNTTLSEGEWIIQVYATTENGMGFETNQVKTITVEPTPIITPEPDTAKPLINPIDSSAGLSFVKGTAATFSTKASDNDILTKIEMYIDDVLVQTVNHNAPVTEAVGISYTADELSIGAHKITVKAYDAAGNYNQTAIDVTVTEVSVCAHQYADKLVNGEKVPVTNSGVWVSQGSNGHVCASIKYVTQCTYCLTESTREAAYPYGNEVQPHMIHTEVLAYGYDEDNHWVAQVRETCSALGCAYSNSEKEVEGKHEPHQMEDGTCTVCGNGVQRGTFKYGGYINQDADSTATYYYSDAYFDADATGKANPHLATMSLCLELSAWTSFDTDAKWNAKEKTQNANNLLTEIGFDEFEWNDGWETEPEMNSIGAVAAYKNIGDTTVIALAIRGGGYYSEWGGNFNIGSDGNHEGFEIARDEVLYFLKYYIRDHKDEFNSTVKLWIVGFSRGGATANMVAGALIDNLEEAVVGIRFKPENVFAYTFEAPMGYVGNNFGYPSIKNYVLTYDLVPLVAPEDWGFGRYNDHDELFWEGSLGSSQYERSVGDFKKQYNKVLDGIPYSSDNQKSDYRIKPFADRFYVSGYTSEWIMSGASSGEHFNITPGIVAGFAQSVTPTDEMLAYTVNMLFDHFPGLRKGYNKDIEKELTEWISFLTAYKEPNIDWGKALNDAFFTKKKVYGYSVGQTGVDRILDYLLSPMSILNPEAKITKAATDAALMVCDAISQQTGKEVNAQLETALKKLIRAALSAFADSPAELVSVVYYIASTGFQCHWPEVSLAWVMSKDSYYTGSSKLNRTGPDAWRKIMICCPVDVIVYDEKGNEFASVRGETVKNASDIHGISITESGAKQVILPSDEAYSIQIIATGNGTMEYTVYEYNVRDGKYNLVENYQKLPLTTGDRYDGSVPAFHVDDYYDAESDGSTAEYTLYGPNDKELQPSTVLRGDDVYYATVSLSTNNNKGLVTGGGSYVASSYVQVEAICMPTVEFLGWYQNGQLVSNEPTYRFAVTKDTELVAHFSEGEYYTLSVTSTEGGIVPEGSCAVPATVQIQLSAEAAEGYEFVRWESTAGTFDDPQKMEAIFTMPSSDASIMAVFQPTESITLPETGDTTPLGLYGLLFIVSAGAMLICLNKTKRETRKPF